MKYFKNIKNNEVFAFEEDGSQDHLITDDMISITNEEHAELTAPPPPTASDIRATRDYLLTETDWVVVKHNELSAPIPQEWLDYRQALRDITEQTGFPEEIEWPQEPES